jgi:Protein of unknown function (DUF3383)
MSISITRYVDITSGVGAGTVVPTRDLVGRLFTGNVFLPPGSFLSFNTADEVGDYFGTTSEEYYRAVFYFSWISKSVTKPGSIQYARWVDVAVAPLIFSKTANNSVIANWTSITSGSYSLTMGGFSANIAALDFSTALSMADVALIIEMSIQNEIGGGALWTAATVTFNAQTGGFDLVGGVTGAADISVAPGGVGTDITVSGLLGWIPQSINTNGTATPGAIWSIGADVETVTDALSASYNLSNNFGSFLFLTNLGLTLAQVVEAATWNYALNNIYLYTVGVLPADAATWAAALDAIGGVGLTLSPIFSPLQYPEMGPMMIEAATNYDATNSVQNYMFQIFNLTPSVTDDATADAYDALRINYYGLTQQSGSQIEFYQRGVLQGTPSSPLGMNTYVNEIWLKDAATAALATLLLAQTQVPANAQGQAMVLNTLQSVIDSALNNGTISVNKTLTVSQQLYVTQVTGDPYAWHQVQDIGYWVNCIIQPAGIEYEAVYILVYSKNDVINFVSGTHILV